MKKLTNKILCRNEYFFVFVLTPHFICYFYSQGLVYFFHILNFDDWTSWPNEATKQLFRKSFNSMKNILINDISYSNYAVRTVITSKD